LAQRFPQARITALDISQAALAAAEGKYIAASNGLSRMLGKMLPKSMTKASSPEFLCANFADTGLPANSYDVIWSNLALHWHAQPDQVLGEWRRILRLNGLVMFSSFGPDTLIELRRAFHGIDAYPHTLPFVDMHDFGDMFGQVGFATPVMDMEKITLRYEKLSQLFSDVRALGGNPLSTRRQGLMGKAAYAKLAANLESMRGSDGRIPLTFEIIYGHAFKPQPTKLASGESIIRLDFPKKPS
jgi:malonyl-CoA O-methyltransferase